MTQASFFFMAGALACGFGGEPFSGLEGKARRATLELNASLAMFENLGSLFSQTALVPVREINILNFQTSPKEERSKECKNVVTKEQKKERMKERRNERTKERKSERKEGMCKDWKNNVMPGIPRTKSAEAFHPG